MPVLSLIRRASALLAALSLAILTAAPQVLRAQGHAEMNGGFSKGPHSLKPVDFLNLFPNVGALIYLAEPNDFGLPPGIVASCTGTLIHERTFLVAGHCTAPTAGGLLPFIKAFVTFSPFALDRSTWREVSAFAFHPSLPPCPPPEYCTFKGLDPGILDIGLVFLSRPVRHITPARLAQPGTLETARAAHSFMIVPGYGFLDSLPDGGHPPMSEWDGLRRIKVSRLERVVDNEWASWSLPGVACFGDSGAPTLFNANPLAGRTYESIVAVVSDGDGGNGCFSRDDRARVDTTSAHAWIRATIAQVLGIAP